MTERTDMEIEQDFEVLDDDSRPMVAHHEPGPSPAPCGMRSCGMTGDATSTPDRWRDGHRRAERVERQRRRLPKTLAEAVT